MAEYLSELMIYVGALTLCVNIITEVLKKAFGWKNNIPTQIICLVISIILSVVGVIVFCQIKSITMLWYYYVGSIILGFFVSYAAMLGFDTLKDTIAQFIKGEKTNE